MAVIVGDTIEIIVSNPSVKNTLKISPSALNNTVTVSQGYVVAASSGSGSGSGGTVTSVIAGEGLLGGEITQAGTISLPDTNVTPGQYTAANITVDAKGRITYATNGSSSSGTGSPLTTQDINITNDSEAFSHMATPIALGTSLEDILIDMLSVYDPTTITLDSLSVSFLGTNGSWSSFIDMTSFNPLEVGEGVRIKGFNKSIGNDSQTQDNSVSIIQNGVIYEQGFSDSTATSNFSQVLLISPQSPSSRQFSLLAIDDGGNENINIYSNSKQIQWRRRVKIGSSSTSSLDNSAEAQVLFDGISTIFNGLTNETTIEALGDEGTNTNGNYTYIIYPTSFGLISSIFQGGSYEVLDDFSILSSSTSTVFNLENDYGVISGYYVYRSNDTGVFGVNTSISVSF